MLRGKKLLLILGIFVLVVAAVVAIFLYLDRSNDSTLQDDVSAEEPVDEQLELETRPVVSRYEYEEVDDILGQDMPTQDMFNKLLEAGSGNVVDEDYDGGVTYIVAALGIADDSVDDRDVQGAKDYLVLIANSYDISEESRAKIIELVGQEVVDDYSPEDNSNEL